MSDSTAARDKTEHKKTSLENAPYFSFWAKDWVVRTALLTPEQAGALINLWAHAWLSTPPCSLPNDDHDLAILSGLRKRWARVGGQVRATFELIDGRLYSKPLLAAHAKMAAEYQRRSAAGIKAAAARWSAPEAEGTASALRSEYNPEPEPHPEPDTNTKKNQPPSDGGGPSPNGDDWQTAVRSVWRDAYGGVLDARDVKPLASLVDKFGVAEVCRRLENFTFEIEARYATIPRFAQTFGKWDSGGSMTSGHSKVERF